MNTQHARKICLFIFIAALISPARAAESEAASDAETQRATCAAKCREDYQSNSAALQACLRDCGAIEPARPGSAIVPGHEATHTVQQNAGAKRTVESSKSNTPDLEVTEPPVPPPAPAETSNLNMSKSNINRSAGGEGEAPADGDSPSTADED